MPDALEVYVEDVVPLGLGDPVRGFAADEDAGVRHHDVDAAQLRDTAVDHRAHGVEIADVGLLGDDPTSEGLDPAHRLGKVLGGGGRIERGDGVDTVRDVEGDDVGALLRQPERVTAPLPPGRTGDERDLSGYSS